MVWLQAWEELETVSQTTGGRHGGTLPVKGKNLAAEAHYPMVPPRSLPQAQPQS